MLFWPVYYSFSYPTIILIIIDPYIPIRCRRNQLNKDIRSMELRITDIYIIGCGAQERRVYKTYSTSQTSRKPPVSYKALHFHSRGDILLYI